MTQRTDFLRQMRREACGPVPFDMSLSPAQHLAMKAHLGHDDVHRFTNAPMRSVSARYIGGAERFRPFFTPECFAASTFNAFGVAYRKGPSFHFDERLPSMAGMTAVEEVDAYPYPDPTVDFDWARVASDIAAVQGQGLAAVCQMQDTLFHIAWQMRGMDNLFVDMMTDLDMADCLLDHVAAVRVHMARKYAALGADVLFLGDDIATQRGMLMQPDLWRSQIKARFPAIIRAAREERPDILIAYHSCGNVTEVVEDLVELGVDILNPIQPECMDPFALKKRFGDRLSFWGGVGTQSLLPFESAQAVYDACQALLKTMSQGGGFVLAPAHMVEPEVPWANIEAMRTAVEDFNQAQETEASMQRRDAH